ncbi:winged helix-turn-helix transcriptional regulator [Nocardia sp. alder85J]|uniref:winged helix-turn-helix transcriptional regulator n=1 Tax=Nocardia sp. alder85J TaxID=2862949 RepID=UPI001CD2E0DD|nr:helix-turn-helix domain-containing protein [Nocardia sp. alder85J]MCX4092542.1 helix-turn-helix domain-containing protein [Nocardia sp. alder85J]
MQKRRSYDQNCPVAKGLDTLGERWTLLIFRELLGGARRYSDLRAELPGIASNLLADRLRELEQSGLIERTELPPPVARTVYSMSETGWRRVFPVLQSLAWFGLPMVAPPDDGEEATPLNGFLAGVLLAFDPSRAGGVDATYRVTIGGRDFEFSVRDATLGPRRGEPVLRITADPADLVRFRSGDADLRRELLPRIAFSGDPAMVDRFRDIFVLSAG